MLSTACPKPAPRATEKLKQRAEELHAIRMCYRAVDLRDEGRCRICRRRCSPTALALLDRAERHHMVYRSQGGTHDTANVITLCKARCHPAIHVSGTLRVSGDSDFRDEMGKLAGVVVERLLESGWEIEQWV